MKFHNGSRRFFLYLVLVCFLVMGGLFSPAFAGGKLQIKCPKCKHQWTFRDPCSNCNTKDDFKMVVKGGNVMCDTCKTKLFYNVRCPECKIWVDSEFFTIK